MKLFIYCIVLVMVLIMSNETYAFSDGAPQDVCSSLDPYGHYPQGNIDSTPPFSIVVNSTVYRGQDILGVTIQGKPKHLIKGFLLQARSAKSPDQYPAVGSFFDLIPTLKPTCDNSGVTHKQLLASNSVTVRWILGNSTWQDIVFKATVMESRYLWYANVNSAIIVAGTSANTTTTSANTTTTSLPSTSPLSATPANTSAATPGVPRPPVPTYVPPATTTTTTTPTPVPNDSKATAATQTAPAESPTPSTPSATTSMVSTTNTVAKMTTETSASTSLPPTSTTQTPATIAATPTAQVSSSSTTLAPTTKASPPAAATTVLPSASSSAESSSTPSSPMNSTATPATTPPAAALSPGAETHAVTDSPLTTAAVANSLLLPANISTGSGTATDNGSTALTPAATTEHGHPASGNVTTTAQAKPEDVRVGSLRLNGTGRAVAGSAMVIGSMLMAVSFLVLFNM